MREVTVSASIEYAVHIGSGLLPQIGNFATAKTKHKKVAVISDSNVWPLYGNTVENSLSDAGLVVCHFVFPAGEASKCGSTYLQIVNFLAQEQLTRDDLLIALGGGVVGDITGFTAATFLRGIAYIQIPTTLLSMVDSSVGGKTAIDLPAGKNLAGAFYQPRLVLCDTDALKTLPENIFREGSAEVIKYGILYDRELFAHLQANGLDFDRTMVITRCVELKRDVVADDEFDRGARQKLNLGHTVGHGIEAASDFALSHGASVAIGMAIVARAAVKLGFCDASVCESIQSILSAFGLPLSADMASNTIYEHALSDKKRSGDTVNLIIPQEIGNCIIRKVTLNELKSFIEVGL